MPKTKANEQPQSGTDESEKPRKLKRFDAGVDDDPDGPTLKVNKAGDDLVFWCGED